MKYVLGFYISTFHSKRAVPNMAVFYISLILCFPGMLLRHCLSDFEMVPVAHVITGILLLSHSTCTEFLLKSLYLKIFSASFLITFLSPGIATSINMHVPFLLSQIMMSSLLLGIYYYYSSWKKVCFYYELRSNIFLYQLTFTYNVGVNEIMRFMLWNFTIWMHSQGHIFPAMTGCTTLILFLEISFTLFFISFCLLHISSLLLVLGCWPLFLLVFVIFLYISPSCFCTFSFYLFIYLYL